MTNDPMWAIKNVLLDGMRKCIVIRGGSVFAIVSSVSADMKGIDASILIAIPAIIDPHVHSRLLGDEHKEDQHTIRLSARQSGVYIMFDMPNNKRTIVTIDAHEEKAALFDGSDVEVLFWFGATANNHAEFPSLNGDPRIVGAKVYMGASTGDLMIAEDTDLARTFEALARNNQIGAVHAEDEGLMQTNYGRLRAAKSGSLLMPDHCHIRDTEVEVSAVRRALALQKRTGVRLYFCHISSPEAVELIKDAKDAGAKVYVEVCPHHIFLGSSSLEGTQGGYFKMNPPLRTLEQIVRLRELVCRPDYVDCIGTDHAPHTVEEKEGCPYEETPSGVPGLDTLFSTLFSLVQSGEMSLDRFISLTSRRAGEIFGIKGAGKIEVGSPANIILVNPASRRILRHDQILSKCGWTPFDGMEFAGGISHLVLGGVCEQIGSRE